VARYLFVTPSVNETPMGWHRLLERYSIARGVTVMMINGTYSSYRYPAQTQTAEASEVYLGGHEYIIDEATKNRLTDPNIGGNYGQYITEL
jgi:histidinol-phosphate/aromatic aminotransferase/cobyric acid decarboxylase-like protein